MNPKTKTANQITVKNTKQEILEAYQKLSQRLEEKRKGTKVPTVTSDSLESEIKELAGLQKQLTQSVSQIFEALVTKTKKVADLVKISQEEEKINRRKRQQEEEEYQFTVSLERKKQEAEFQEDLREKEKESAEKEKALEEKREEFKQLQAQTATFPKQLEQAVKEATEGLTAELKKEKESEIKFLTQKFENELSLAQFKIKSLEETKAKQDKEIAQLKDQLARASREVKEIAVAVIESTGKTGGERTKPEETTD